MITWLYLTVVEHDASALWPTLSSAVAEVVLTPTVLVLIGTVPLGFTASPDCPSEAVTVAFALLP